MTKSQLKIKILAKLKAEKTPFDNYDASIRALSGCVAAKNMIEVYKELFDESEYYRVEIGTPEGKKTGEVIILATTSEHAMDMATDETGLTAWSCYPVDEGYDGQIFAGIEI